MKKVAINFSILSIMLILFAGCGSSPNSSSGSDGMGMNNNPPSDNNNNNDSDGDAPDFTYNSLSGSSYTLSDYTGNVIYLFFYGAQCPHCRANGHVTEEDIYQEFKSNGQFKAFGLDTWNQSAAQNRDFKDVTGITYTLLLNAEQSLIDYYGDASKYDRSVVIDADGNIAYKGTDFVNTDADSVAKIIQAELDKL